MHSTEKCVICGTGLDIHQAARSRSCQSPECIRKYAAEVAGRIKQRHQRNRDLENGRANTLVRSLMASGQLARRAQHRVAPVPSFNRQLRPADHDRLQQYAAHLDELLIQWATEQEQEQEQVQERVSPEAGCEVEESGPELYAQACATCRGKCCRTGKTHGYQTIDTIRQWFALHPDSDIEDCRQAYLSRLGDYSYENSCVFHGAEGCYLPTRMRSDTCNTWTCWRMKELQKQTRKQQVPVTIIVAAEAAGIQRLNVIDSLSGERLEPEIEAKKGCCNEESSASG